MTCELHPPSAIRTLALLISSSSDADGTPPCRRCARENQECILVKSRRGGRRVRRSSIAAAAAGAPPSHASDSADIRGERDQNVTVTPTEADETWRPRPTPPQRPMRPWNEGWEERRSPVQRRRSDGVDDIENHIASADLLNPSDALNLLAQVADRDAEGRRESALQTSQDGQRSEGGSFPVGLGSSSSFPPISEGHLTVADAARLLGHYHDKYHPYYPIAHKDIFMNDNVSQWVDDEPHLLTAVLTVASKDEPSWAGIHEACSKYMETLISKLIYRGSTTVGAVEALLILAEWAPQRLQEKPTIGRGEEDQGAWMQVGVAIRLGYLQRLEQTGLYQGKEPKTDQFSRKQLAWAACYMSDRHVSIRLGKGFWSRGPGPNTVLRAADFPTLKAQQMGSDDLSLLFQAHLELTQLFGNAHDILYSSASHREHLYLGGEYVRYIVGHRPRRSRRCDGRLTIPG